MIYNYIMNDNSPFWIVGLILSIFGAILIFLSWFDAKLLIASVSYDAFDMAFGSPFQSGGVFENFDPIGKFCPLLFGLISLINIALFIKAKDGNYSRLILITSILMIILPIYVLICINPGSGVGWARDPGIAIYIGIVLGIASMIVGHLGSRANA